MTFVKTTFLSIFICLLLTLSVSAQSFIGEMNLDGSAKQLLYEYSGVVWQPHWSSNMSKITFTSATSSTGKSEIFTINLLTDQLCQLTSYGNTYGQSYPRYFDDTTIWYSYTAQSGFSEMRELIVGDCNVLKDSILTDYYSLGKQTGSFDLSDTLIVYYVQNSSWSPSAELYMGSKYDLMNATQITSNSGLNERSPDISDDESKIVYLRDDGSGTPHHIFTMNIDGTNNIQLPFVSNEYSNPLWSADGAKIYYSFYDGVQYDIYVMDFDGANPQNITNTPDFDEHIYERTNGKILFTTTEELHSNSLTIPSITSQPCDSECVVLPVVADLNDAIEGFQVPLTYAPPLSVCSVSTAGLTTDGWTTIFSDIDNTNGILSVSMAQGAGVELPAGIDTLFYIYFYAPPQCNSESYYTWDTTYSGDPFKQLAFVDTSGAVILPSFVADTVTIDGYIPGDFNNSGSVDISDLVAFVAWAFQGGPLPCIMNSIDVNGSGGVPDIGDLVYLVNYMFGGGSDLQCGAIGIVSTAKLSTSESINLSSTIIDGKTVINLTSESNILGLELYVSGKNFNSINTEFSELDLLYRQDNNTIKIGLLDLDGTEYIPVGNNNILELDGEFEIVSAIVVDDKLNSYSPRINSIAKGGLIPDAFSLNQNYPNPFNPTTSISFSLPEANDVRLEVFNIQGQRVSTLVNKFYEAGNHTIDWDGSKAASGVYLYKLQAGSFTETKKMLLLK